MLQIPDHPIIRNMERTGYPDGKEPKDVTCPICGEPCETAYLDVNRFWLGCDHCVQVVPAADLEDLEDDDYG